MGNGSLGEQWPSRHVDGLHGLDHGWLLAAVCATHRKLDGPDGNSETRSALTTHQEVEPAATETCEVAAVAPVESVMTMVTEVPSAMLTVQVSEVLEVWSKELRVDETSPPLVARG